MPMNSTNSGLLGGIGVDRKIQELTKRYGGDDLSVGLLPSPPGFFEYPQGTIRSAPTDRFSGLISGPLDTSMDSGLPSMKSDNQIAREAADQALGLGPENMAGGGGGRGAGLFRGVMGLLGGKKGPGLLGKNTAASKVFSKTQIDAANRTSRAGGAVGKMAVTPRWIADNVGKSDKILDFGAGRDAIHAKKLRANGYSNVTAHEFGGNFTEGIHKPNALSETYDVVYASNVLNVQSSEEMLRRTLGQIRGAVSKDGFAVFNYPASPRKSDLTVDQVSAIIAEVFPGPVKRVNKGSGTPIWTAKLLEGYADKGPGLLGKVDSPAFLDNINPDNMSREILSKVNRTLKSKGYDVRGPDDVLMLMKRDMVNDGVVINPDWIDAISKATGIKASNPRISGKGITAFHGSPHDFDKFSMSKLGTGEGAQAYGHGLYFSATEDVGRGYQGSTTKVPADYKIKGKSVLDMSRRAVDSENHEIAEVLESVMLHRNPTELKAQFSVKSGYAKNTEDFVKGIDYDTLRAVDYDGKTIPMGRTYKVELNTNTDEMLDYEKRYHDQPPDVKNALYATFSEAAEKKGIDVNDLMIEVTESTGGSIYSDLVSVLGSAEAATKALKAKGITGIRYLDQNSRPTAGGTDNFVIFDDKTVEIIKKYGFAALVGGGAGLIGGNSEATQ